MKDIKNKDKLSVTKEPPWNEYQNHRKQNKQRKERTATEILEGQQQKCWWGLWPGFTSNQHCFGRAKKNSIHNSSAAFAQKLKVKHRGTYILLQIRVLASVFGQIVCVRIEDSDQPVH